MTRLITLLNLCYLCRPDIGEMGLVKHHSIINIGEFIWIYQWRV